LVVVVVELVLKPQVRPDPAVAVAVAVHTSQIQFR
jgi:hypothetical protein